MRPNAVLVAKLHALSATSRRSRRATSAVAAQYDWGWVAARFDEALASILR